jgi:hypothetical protein
MKSAFELFAVGESLNKLREITGEVIETTSAAYRLSGALGITTQSLQSLQYAAKVSGVDTESFNSSIDKLTKNLGAAEQGTGPAAAALRSIGIEGSQLKGLKIDDAFKLIADRISQIHDPAERARAETELFGKSGQQLGPMFAEGAAGISAAQDEAIKLGVAMNDVDAAKVLQAHEAMEKISTAIEGVENQFVIALAPILTDISGRISSLFPPAERFREVIVNGFKDAAEVGGYMADVYTNILTPAVLAVPYAAVGAFELLIKALQGVIDGIIWVSNKVFGTNLKEPKWIGDTLNTVDAWRTSIGNDIKDAWNNPSHANAVDKFFDHINSAAQQSAQQMVNRKDEFAAPIAQGFEDARTKVEGTLEKMRQEVAQFGMTKQQKAVEDVISQGGSASQIAEATFLQFKLGALEKMKQMAEDTAKKQEEMANEGKRLIEDSMTPLQKYQQQVDHLGELFQQGFIDQQTYNDQLTKAKDAIDHKDAAATKTKETADTLERRFDFRLPPPKANPNDPAHQQLSEAKTTNNLLKSISKSLGEKPKIVRI